MLGDEQVMESSLTFRATEVLHHLRNSEAFQALDSGQRTALESGFPAAVKNRLYDADSGPAAHVFQVSVAKAVARVIGLPGPAAIGDAACASGLTVIDTAVKYLQDGSHDMVLATGVQGNMNITGNVCFAKIGGLSATRSTPLDEGASGLINGEGSGTVLLKRLSDAVRDGDTIAGVIRGVATRCDGKGKAIYAPSSRGQVAAMRRALELADARPGSSTTSRPTPPPPPPATSSRSAPSSSCTRTPGRSPAPSGSVRSRPRSGTPSRRPAWPTC